MIQFKNNITKYAFKTWAKYTIDIKDLDILGTLPHRSHMLG